MTTRTVRRAVAAAALAAVTALSLTACGGSSKDGSDTAKADGAEQSASPDDEGSDGGDEADDDAKSSPQATGDACTPAQMKVEARAVPSPAHHVLLVATNTGKKECTAYGFPFLRFDQDQATAGVTEESKPGAALKLAPGKAAYAGVTASASGGNGRDVKKLSVSFQTPNGDPVDGDPSVPALPGGTLHVDDSAKGTYWVGSEDAALKW
ncbi:DUF4232 domain-containing protein [Streptomyces morookaense]|uniref:DUF4232 domain-containing protein n=1 Tax=Streptomyces TaxID=1883 RepID=UPI001D0FBA20|nr:DUF4232 domain-containing protein [Streptomyces sp. ET3-23]MCC2275085.1 DUF4232 domain-containing protein [Streptomyces sp. ET3-23]